MEGSDLGSTVIAIMHHAPVLRSRQVAVSEKLWRSSMKVLFICLQYSNSVSYFASLSTTRMPSVEQQFLKPGTFDDLNQIGTNCPTSVPSLLLGCVEAYSLAISHGNSSIVVNVAKQEGTR
jgi:hypothetical protein